VVLALAEVAVLVEGVAEAAAAVLVEGAAADLVVVLDLAGAFLVVGFEEEAIIQYLMDYFLSALTQSLFL
jgi:hypothetical protein